MDKEKLPKDILIAGLKAEAERQEKKAMELLSLGDQEGFKEAFIESVALEALAIIEGRKVHIQGQETLPHVSSNIPYRTDKIIHPNVSERNN